MIHRIHSIFMKLSILVEIIEYEVFAASLQRSQGDLRPAHGRDFKVLSFINDAETCLLSIMAGS